MRRRQIGTAGRQIALEYGLEPQRHGNGRRQHAHLRLKEHIAERATGFADDEYAAADDQHDERAPEPGHEAPGQRYHTVARAGESEEPQIEHRHRGQNHRYRQNVNGLDGGDYPKYLLNHQTGLGGPSHWMKSSSMGRRSSEPNPNHSQSRIGHPANRHRLSGFLLRHFLACAAGLRQPIAIACFRLVTFLPEPPLRACRLSFPSWSFRLSCRSPCCIFAP